MKLNVIVLVCVILLSISATNVSAHSIGCGIVMGKALKLPKPKRPSNLTGTVEVKVKIDENGDVYSAQSLLPNSELRQRTLEKAVQAKFKHSTINGLPVLFEGTIKYIFTAGKSKAEISVESSLNKDYEKFVVTQLYCSSLFEKINDYLIQKNKSELTGEKLSSEKIQFILFPKENKTESLEKLRNFGVKIISDDTNYFDGIYSEISIDKILDLAELDAVNLILSLDELDVCEYKLFIYNKLKSENCEEFKESRHSTKVFYGNQTEKIISPKTALPESLKNSDKKVFVQIKFDADGNIIEAKSVSGNAELSTEAENFIRQIKLEPQQVNNDLKYSVGLLIYNAELFIKAETRQ